MTIRSVRGPCTPSTRFSSMSEVADGPGDERERATVADGGLEPLDCLGHEVHHLAGPDDADVEVGHRCQRPAAY